MRVKLADFGLSRQIIQGSEGEVSMFQARWTAPEIWDYFDEGVLSLYLIIDIDSLLCPLPTLDQLLVNLIKS